MGVLTRRIVATLSVLMLLALTVSASAKPIHTTINLVSNAKINGTSLKAGEYNVNADETKVTVVFEGKVIAESKVEWKDSTSKAASTSVLIAGDEIKEIRFKGQTRYAIVTP
jgi:hypothetical protein